MEHNKTVSKLSCQPHLLHRRTASTTPPPAWCSLSSSFDPPKSKSKPLRETDQKNQTQIPLIRASSSSPKTLGFYGTRRYCKLAQVLQKLWGFMALEDIVARLANCGVVGTYGSK